MKKIIILLGLISLILTSCGNAETKSIKQIQAEYQNKLDKFKTDHKFDSLNLRHLTNFYYKGPDDMVTECVNYGITQIGLVEAKNSTEKDKFVTLRIPGIEYQIVNNKREYFFFKHYTDSAHRESAYVSMNYVNLYLKLPSDDSNIISAGIYSNVNKTFDEPYSISQFTEDNNLISNSYIVYSDQLKFNETTPLTECYLKVEHSDNDTYNIYFWFYSEEFEHSMYIYAEDLKLYHITQVEGGKHFNEEDYCFIPATIRFIQ